MKGTIARVWPEKSFGFIKGENGTDYFFHRSDVNGFFDDFGEDFARNVVVEVTFDVAPSTKGPRAANVTRTDG